MLVCLFAVTAATAAFLFPISVVFEVYAVGVRQALCCMDLELYDV